MSNLLNEFTFNLKNQTFDRTNAELSIEGYNGHESFMMFEHTPLRYKGNLSVFFCGGKINRNQQFYYL